VYPQVFGKYVLERELSRGGMARVVLATLRGAGGFEKKLVVKQIRDELSFDQQFVRRFVEEAKTTVALSHPNIVPVYELGVEQGTYFLAMELVEGCSIAELVRERNFDGTKRVLSPEEGAYIGMEVCRALDYAHRRMKVVHRDITPRNVMLDEEGAVKLIDFGIAAPALVAGHEILGSPGHMPPEQVEGKELGPPTDIFAVATLLMEAWSGIAPFRRATPEECDEAMRNPHPRPSDFDPRLIPLDDVIIRALKLDPKERQQDAADVARALRAFLQGTDLADIARELGDRVRDLREAASEPMPMSLDGSARAPNPSIGDMGTKTFAARDEAIRWSRPPASEIEPPGASTRKLRESMPPPSDAPEAGMPESLTKATPMGATPVSLTKTTPLGETPVSTKSAARSKDPAMSIPTPLMIEPVGVTGDVVLRSARAAQDAAIASHKSERPRGSDTLATQSLETAITPRRERPRARSRAWSFVAVGALFAVGAAAAWTVKSSSGRNDGVPTATTTTMGSPSTTTTGVSSTAPPLVPSAKVATSATPAVTTGAAPLPIVPGTHSAPLTSASAATSGRAFVSLLGDPGTRVSIDGTSRGSCPVRVNLEPGQHDVRFQFDPTGESRGERFSVKAGDRVTVRAEFTGATPTVRIQR
jgi:eukaryotic-like serine/threonine-protein kinase